MVPESELSGLLGRIEALLDDVPPEHDPMLLSQVDGLLAAVLVAPKPLPDDAWLSLIWGGPQPKDVAYLTKLRDLLAERTAEMVARFREGGIAFNPVFDVHHDTGTTFWQFWMSGFSAGVQLYERAWLKLVKAKDEDLAASVLGLSALMELAGDPDPPENELEEQALDLIPYLVETLYRRQHKLDRIVLTDDVELSSPKVGRNDPCPCGSGRKFKKCCGGL